MRKPWAISAGSGPLVAAAIHDGHEVREEIAPLLAVDGATRLREEDPFTYRWTAVAPTRIGVRRSRFEVDLNRPRDRAVYVEPADAWGIAVWRSPPSPELVSRSLALYDGFYAEVKAVLQNIQAVHGGFVVFDLHTYNHRRDGPHAPPAAAAANPQVNIGTGTMDRARWGPLVDRFIGDLGQAEVAGHRLDVRENVKFQGGAFSRWVHDTFPGTGCSLAIEFKKFFMDEWTGELHEDTAAQVDQALRATVPGVTAELSRIVRSDQR